MSWLRNILTVLASLRMHFAQQQQQQQQQQSDTMAQRHDPNSQTHMLSNVFPATLYQSTRLLAGTQYVFTDGDTP